VARALFSLKVSRLFTKKRVLRTNHRDAQTAEEQRRLRETTTEISEDNAADNRPFDNSTA
jgi:hypothetical protein